LTSTVSVTVGGGGASSTPTAAGGSGHVIVYEYSK
jgi:hypothetical protein